ncbi:hypothetical protein PRK78_000103 [Emydomyces testavorans]|uniref:Orotidine 5'-phosphate decarboxylase n=1 Tax=Emydomyces testavorans TaxID=2070801 RepID=A0AAF0DB24_9EURO|nr:hypothetical protein PRK78_000103 [Emydomyces testavorans]
MNAATAPPSRNPLTTYLRLLQRTKTSLPHGQLVCVSASPNISTMDGLLRLACAVGPHIAVLQLHADIIDDWSMEAVRRLTSIAKKFGFLIWEGGRILNTKRRPTGQQALSTQEIARDIAMARKRYTKGISVAAWAGLASTWVIGPEEQEKGGGQLIPTLRRAARETVARMTMSVRTEISGGQTPCIVGAAGDDLEESIYDDEQDQDVFDDSLRDLNSSQPLRKGSVISLTRTITQHAEPSRPMTMELEHRCECDESEFPLDDKLASPNILPPPPLLSRGMVICLPNNADTQCTPQHRQAAIAAGKAHNDFVVGYVTEEPWINVQRDQALAHVLALPNSHETDGDEHEDSSDCENERNPDDAETYVIFSPLENEHFGRKPHVAEPYSTNGGTAAVSPSSPHQRSKYGVKAQQISALHQLVGRALSIQATTGAANASVSSTSSKQCGPDILYIPIITMNF